jgi:hypothetical protein
MPDDLPPAGGSGPDAGPPPGIVSRKEIQAQARGTRSRQRWWWAVGGVAVVVIGAGVAVALTRPSSPSAHSSTTSTTVRTAATVTVCPLTGTPAPAGTVPARPALAVKIGNYSITRLVAVFQCQAPALVGDLRSAREPDVGILSQLSNPIFVHAGGIQPVNELLNQAALQNDDLYTGGRSSAIIFQPGRVSPYSTFVNTSTLWAFDPQDTSPPAPIFSFTAAPPTGAVAGSGGSAHIPFGSSSDVTWTWSPAAGHYLRSYAGQPDVLLDKSQTAASNVVIETVQTSQGSWVENSEGGLEVLVTATGSGPVTVLRNGVALTGTWSRSSLTSPATFTTTAGQPITLAPGNTWVELVPQGIPVTVTPSAPPPPTTPTTTAPAAGG